MLRAISIEMLAGVFTVVTVGAAVVYFIVANPDAFAGKLTPAVLLLLANLAAMLMTGDGRLSRQQRRFAHAAQGATIVALAWLLTLDFLQIFTIVWLAMAIDLYRMRVCVVLLAGIVAFWLLVGILHWQSNSTPISVALFTTFHIFALLTSRTAQRAERARDEIQSLYRELKATQHLLNAAARQQERTRIARDLHDLVGHHLTALSINLQIAERTSDGVAREKIEACRALARLLLADVREAVSTLREDASIDFATALQSLVDGVPQLETALTIDDTLQIEDVETADTIVRCVQECLTNVLRHAHASRCEIRVWQDAGEIRFSVRDNGASVAAIQEGNGFAGMRERLAELGGLLHWQRQQPGLAVTGRIPVRAR